MSTYLSDIDLRDAYKKFSVQAGNFKAYVRSTPFVSLQHYPNFELTTEFSNDLSKYHVKKITIDDIKDELLFDLNSNASFFEVISSFDSKTTLFIIDLPGTISLEFAYLLYKDLSLAPVVNFNGIFHPNGLVGDQLFVSQLLWLSKQIDIENKTNGHALILDSNRYGDYSEDDLQKNFNNQYELSEVDFPSQEMLEALNFEHILLITQPVVKDESLAYIKYIVSSGIKADILGVEI